MGEDRWVLTVTAFTDRGAVRPGNEDTVGVGDWISPQRMEEPVVITLAAVAPLILVVADGMGGHSEGARASRATVACLLQRAAGITDEHLLAKSLEQANAELYGAMLQEPDLVGMGTTVAGLLVVPPRCLSFNVGDSRVFVERGGFLRQLTVDDSWQSSESSFDPLEAVPGGVITQAIGGQAAFVEIEPHVVATQMVDGQRFLVCSDGLTDALALDVLEAGLASDDDRHVVRGWYAAAMQANARDNLSILLVRVSLVAGGTAH